MPDFLARVQLQDIHQNTSEAYERLHEAMASAGFGRTIKGSMAMWQLPDGTYIGKFELSSPDVRDKAVHAVQSIGKRAQVIVVQFEHAAWSGLVKNSP